MCSLVLCDEVMTVAAHFGVDNILFVTVSLNPRWEIIGELCRAHGRRSGGDLVDIYTHVFDTARGKLYTRLRAGHYIPQHSKGDSRKCLGILDSDEWQKRKLPHAHLAARYSGPPWTARDVDGLTWTHTYTEEEKRSSPASPSSCGSS